MIINPYTIDSEYYCDVSNVFSCYNHTKFWYFKIDSRQHLYSDLVDGGHDWIDAMIWSYFESSITAVP